MITKERLQELIEQGATIYEVKFNKIKAIELKYRVEAGYKWQYIKVYSNTSMMGNNHYLINLFETKEQAEWHKEFGNITRTEKLWLPPYEEVMCDLKGKRGVYTVAENDDFFLEVFIDNEHPKLSQIWVLGLFDMPLTKENYILACRKCKELFLGGGNEINND